MNVDAIFEMEKNKGPKRREKKTIASQNRGGGGGGGAIWSIGTPRKPQRMLVLGGSY